MKIRNALALSLFALLVTPTVVAGCGAYPESEDVAGDDHTVAEVGEVEQAHCQHGPGVPNCPNGPPSSPSLGGPPSNCSGGPETCGGKVSNFAADAFAYYCNAACCAQEDCNNVVSAIKNFYDTCLTAEDNGGNDGGTKDKDNPSCEADARCGKCNAGCYNLPLMQRHSCITLCRKSIADGGQNCAGYQPGD